MAAFAGSAMLALSIVGPVAAAPSTAKAVIHEDFGRRASARPCTQVTGGVECAGDGIVAGFGRVTSLAVYNATPVVTRVLTFADGSTITIEETYADPTFPGKSTDAPGSILHSFGNPYMQTSTWEIVGSTGGAAGTTGSGTGTVVASGDTLVFTFQGTTQLP
jgi:hypothetical protein